MKGLLYIAIATCTILVVLLLRGLLSGNTPWYGYVIATIGAVVWIVYVIYTIKDLNE